MDEIRNFISHERRKNNSFRSKKEENRIKPAVIDILIVQIIICLLIAIVFVIINIFNKEFNNYMLDIYIKELSVGSSINDIFKGISKSFNNILPKKEEELGVGGESKYIFEDDQDISLSEEDFINFESILSSRNIVYPINGGRQSSFFGYRQSPFSDEKEFHKALDIAAEKGTDIYAVSDGKVIIASTSTSLGKYIKIDHGDGFFTRYGHCDKLLVKEGQIVKAGEVIAKVGTTGQSTGNHLHLEMMKDNVNVDPLRIFKEAFND